MTLLAGIKCTDGYIIAADTALTRGQSVYRGQKIASTVANDRSYRIVIAGSGHMGFARMASEEIVAQVAVSHSHDPHTSIAVMKEIVKSVIVNIYAKHISMHWSKPGGAETPDFSLIVGIESRDEHALLLTDTLNSVSEIQTCEFIGSGQDLATYLAERLLINKVWGTVWIPTAVALHMVREIFKAAKTSSAYVGGSTEIVARLTSEKARPFFHFADENEGDSPHQSYLWDLHSDLTYAIWSALDYGGPISFEDGAKRLQESLGKLRASFMSAQQSPKTQTTLHVVYLPSGESISTVD